MFYLTEYKPILDTAACSAGMLPEWAQLCILAMGASAMILGCMYLIASFFQNQQATLTVKMEIYEMAVSGIIFIAIAMLLGGMCTIKTGWIFPDAGTSTTLGGFESWADKTLYYSSTNYLMAFADHTLRMMSVQYGFYVLIDAVTSTEISSVPMGIGATMKPTSGLGAVVKPVMNNAFSAETISVITTQAQAYTIDYLGYGLLKYFLPFALVMRSFTPTRRIGGTIIAVTLVFLFLVPIITIPAYLVINSSFSGTIDHMKQSMDLISGGASAGIFSTFGTPTKIVLEFVVTYMWGPDILLLMSMMIIPGAAKIFLGGVFFPLVNVIILVTSARYLSKALGEEIDITNISRMI